MSSHNGSSFIGGIELSCISIASTPPPPAPTIDEESTPEIRQARMMKIVMDEGIIRICRYIVLQNRIPLGRRILHRMGFVNNRWKTLERVLQRLMFIERSLILHSHVISI